MTPKEIKNRVEELEKKKKKEYYLNNRDAICKRMREYGKKTRAERTQKEKEYRNTHTLKYAETMLRYWTRKVEELRREENNECTAN